MGHAHYSKGEYDLAISDCNKALEINPRLVDAYICRGLVYDRKGKYDQAISDYTKSLEIDQSNAIAYSNRAVIYYHMGKYDKAWEDVHKLQSMGKQIPPEFLKDLRQASGREK